VFGKDKTMKPARLASPDPFLKPENTGKKSDHISEADILFTIDEADKEPDEDVVQKTATEKTKKNIDNHIKNKSILTNKLVSEYLKKGKKFEARNELSDLYFRETDNQKKNEIKNKLDESSSENKKGECKTCLELKDKVEGLESTLRGEDELPYLHS